MLDLPVVGELDVVTHVEIEVPVGVDVEKRDPGSHAVAVSHACSLGDVGEGAVSVVPVEDVGPEVVHVEVGVAVVIVIAHGDAEPVSRIADARLRRHVGELPVPFVPIERVARHRVGLRSPQWCPVEEVDVDPPVAVVVEQRESRGDVFDDVVSAAAAVGVPEVDSRLPRDVAEHDRPTLVACTHDRGRRGARDEPERHPGPWFAQYRHTALHSASLRSSIDLA